MPLDKTILPAKMNAFFAGKLQGKDPATAMAVYSSQDPYFNGLGKFIRNPSCWLNGVKNISCFSPAQMSGANWWQRGGTLITRKHVLFAKHFVTAVLEGNGTPLIFVADDNTVIRRNIIQYAYIPWTDVGIALLDSEVPANIQIAKVLPKNYTDYFELGPATPVYCAGLDQQEKALVKVSTGGNSNGITYDGQYFTYRTFAVNETLPSHQFQLFNETIIVGDSGNPLFLILENELVVTTTWWVPTSGPFISDTRVYDAANAAIESLSPGQGYALTDVNLALAYESMQKLYFNGDVNTGWGTLANWWQNSDHTVPAIALPTGPDIPVVSWASTGHKPLLNAGVLGSI